jgi:hypothetical protein
MRMPNVIVQLPRSATVRPVPLVKRKDTALLEAFKYSIWSLPVATGTLLEPHPSNCSAHVKNKPCKCSLICVLISKPEGKLSMVSVRATLIPI